MADAIILAHGLTKIYTAGPPTGDVVAVDEIELEINSGEIAGRIVIVSATGDLPKLADSLVAGVEGARQSRIVEGRIHLSVDDSSGLLPRIIDAAEAGGSSVNDLSVTEPTLESVFINLTGKDLRE